MVQPVAPTRIRPDLLIRIGRVQAAQIAPGDIVAKPGSGRERHSAGVYQAAGASVDRQAATEAEI
jgi:hypothetical protein